MHVILFRFFLPQRRRIDPLSKRKIQRQKQFFGCRCCPDDLRNILQASHVLSDYLFG